MCHPATDSDPNALDESHCRYGSFRSLLRSVYMSSSIMLFLVYISKKSLNLENSGELWRTLEYSGVLKVQRFFADV